MKAKTVLGLTGRLELFTEFVAIPIGIYFIVVLGSLETLQEVLVLILGAAVAASSTGVVHWYFRRRHIGPALAIASGELEADEAKMIAAKASLMKQPVREIIGINLRWLFGIPIGYGLFHLIMGYKASFWATAPFTYLGLVPISSVGYMLMTEDFLVSEINGSILERVIVPFRARFRYSHRMFLTMGTMVIMPFTLLGYMLIVTHSDFVKLNNMGLHLFTIAMLMVLPLGITTWMTTRAIRNRLGILNGILAKVGEGKMDLNISASSPDEFGQQEQNIRNVVGQLRAMFSEIQDLNQNLERKVVVRTEELHQTLREVTALKTQQDGDYFLTTLLLKPLGVNAVKSENIKIDFYMNQKKKFSFKKWNSEIGGDLNIAHNIVLKGKNYVVFMNADAMGKSIQGAGGAIVLGALFQAIIERTRLSPKEKDVYPERWIKLTFDELHKAFTTFDGSMLVSMALGIVAEESGLMYYINVEHPWSVLYRQGTATFIEDGFCQRKLGMAGATQPLVVKVLQLQAGDIVFAGSDGRDDLILRGHEKAENPPINEDETIFLRNIEAVGGEIELIPEAMAKVGTLMDDFSMVRLAYQDGAAQQNLSQAETREVSRAIEAARQAIAAGNVPEAISELENILAIDNRHPHALKKILGLLIQRKEYARAVPRAEDFMVARPIESEPIYIASFTYRKSKEPLKAIELGERLRLRNPAHKKNLQNLSQAYRDIGDHDRAAQIESMAAAV